MTKATRSGGVLVPGCWVNLWVVVSVVGAAQWHEFVVSAQDWTEHNWQVLIIGDHLNLGDVQATSLLEQILIVPVWMTVSQLSGVDVVVAEQQSVQSSQGRVLVATHVTGLVASAAKAE